MRASHALVSEIGRPVGLEEHERGDQTVLESEKSIAESPHILNAPFANTDTVLQCQSFE